MKNVIALAALAGALCMTSAATAQNTNLATNYGEVTLRSGFDPDPYTVQVTAGGGLDAYDDTPLPAACVGRISNNPDFRLRYTAGKYELFIKTISSKDTTLVINDPDGDWVCDDDSYGDGDAQVRFRSPKSGVYDIWVGAYDGGTPSTTLVITERE